MTLYQYNETAAIQSEQGGRITEPGAYTGMITMAKKVVSSQKQTQGIEFTFESDSGATANYLSLWTFDAQGKQLFGFNQVCSIMKLLGVNEFSSKNAMVDELDFSSMSMQKVQREVFFDLMRKPIGFALDTGNYQNKQGETKQKMVFKFAFCPKTKRTTAEIINNQPATKVNNFVERVMSKSVSLPPQNAHNVAKQDGYQPQPSLLVTPENSADFDNSDIPF